MLGHEFGGRVAGTAGGWRAGAVVAVNPLGSCGTCRECGRGLPFRCAAKPNLNISAPGGFAQYAAVPAEQLVVLPAGLPAELGAHAEPLAAVARAGVVPGDPVLVYGAGSIGLTVIRALRLAGAGLIVAAGRSPRRRAAAARVGADEVLDTRELGGAEYARRGRPVPRCAGARWYVRRGGAAARPRSHR